MRHYARNIGDLAAATRGLDLLHRGAYDALLDAYYLRELPLPADARECYLLADARSPAERRAVDFVLGRFFALTPDGYRQKRCDRELATFAAKSDKARASAAARWAQRESDANASGEQCESDANASETHGKRNATHYPLPTTQENPTPPLPAGASPPQVGRQSAAGGLGAPGKVGRVGNERAARPRSRGGPPNRGELRRPLAREGWSRRPKGRLGSDLAQLGSARKADERQTARRPRVPPLRIRVRHPGSSEP